MKAVKFEGIRKPEGFDADLRNRVRKAFIDGNISRYGNNLLYTKTVVITILLITPLVLPYFFTVDIINIVFLGIVAGIAMAGIGMGTMHGAMHSSYHKKRWVNKLIGIISAVFISLFYDNWDVQHNKKHHSHTNIGDHDEDIGSNKFRFTKEMPWRKMHKRQHIYAPFLYSLMTLLRATTKDWTQLHCHLSERNKPLNFRLKEFLKLLLSKIMYYFVWVVLPLIYWEVSAIYVLVFFVIKHLVCGLILSHVFQLAHIVPETTSFSKEDVEKGTHSRMVHQLMTTSNFATSNKFMFHYCGGLNYQVEHHLFPGYSEIHYPFISEIVKETCRDYGVPYLEHETFFAALQAHFQHLKDLGQEPREKNLVSV